MIRYLGLDICALLHEAVLTQKDRQSDAVWGGMPTTGTKVSRLALRFPWSCSPVNLALTLGSNSSRFQDQRL